jgi:hypothetical protein
MNFRFLALVLAAATMVGCAAPSASPEVVVVNLPGSAFSPAQVKVYVQPPKKYKEITVITSSSKGSLTTTPEEKRSVVIERIKTMAGTLGANGILIHNIGAPAGGSVGAAADNGGVGVAGAADVPSVGSATAIFVEQE